MASLIEEYASAELETLRAWLGTRYKNATRANVRERLERGLAAVAVELEKRGVSCSQGQLFRG